MNLKEYLDKNGMKQQHFASLVDCSRVYISYICTGFKKPGKHLAKRIELLTNGEVTEFPETKKEDIW